MIITEDFARRAIEEVKPKVEDASELEGDLLGYVVLVLPAIRENGIYFHPDKLFAFNGKPRENVFSIYNQKNNLLIFNRSENYQICVVGHEVAHNVQFSSFPGLWEKLYGTNGDSPLKKLVEGDATLIQLRLREIFLWVSGELMNSKEYFEWSEILRRRFNGNRKDINELYTAPVKELNKIFGVN